MPTPPETPAPTPNQTRDAEALAPLDHPAGVEGGGESDDLPAPDPVALALAGVEPVALRHGLVVLQHPQEKGVAIGTARLLTEQVAGAVLKIGLSWPNLAKVLGDPDVDQRRWGVLYMGSQEDVARAPRGGLAVLDRAGRREPDSDLVLRDLSGIVVLDGTWSQAKTLWWRNPWLLKLRRIVVNPDFRSAYGSVRKEPRREGLSTLEAGAFVLSQLAGDPALLPRLTAPFPALLAATKRPGLPAGRRPAASRPNAARWARARRR